MAPMDKRHQEIQELLSHPGWEHFKDLLLGPDSLGKPKCLVAQLNDKLMAEARCGDQIKSAMFAGQIDIIPVILALPEKELEKAMNQRAPTSTN